MIRLIARNKGVSLASLYCDRATRGAFKLLFHEFFDAILRVTGKSLKLAAFDGGTGLYNFIFDGEIAQMQGLGDVLLSKNDPSLSKIVTKDPLVLYNM